MRNKSAAVDYGMIVIGTVLMSMGIKNIFDPANMVTGGPLRADRHFHRVENFRRPDRGPEVFQTGLYHFRPSPGDCGRNFKRNEPGRHRHDSTGHVLQFGEKYVVLCGIQEGNCTTPGAGFPL